MVTTPDHLAAPAANAAAVTPHDSNDLAATSRALYIGTSGDVKVDMVGTGTAVVFSSVPVGLLPVRVTRVYSTDTTASNIVSIY